MTANSINTAIIENIYDRWDERIMTREGKHCTIDKMRITPWRVDNLENIPNVLMMRVEYNHMTKSRKDISGLWKVIREESASNDWNPMFRQAAYIDAWSFLS